MHTRLKVWLIGTALAGLVFACAWYALRAAESWTRPAATEVEVLKSLSSLARNNPEAICSPVEFAQKTPIFKISPPNTAEPLQQRFHVKAVAAHGTSMEGFLVIAFRKGEKKCNLQLTVSPDSCKSSLLRDWPSPSLQRQLGLQSHAHLRSITTGEKLTNGFLLRSSQNTLLTIGWLSDSAICAPTLEISVRTQGSQA